MGRTAPWALLLVTVGFARTLGAQSVEGLVLAIEPDTPLEGAGVELLDSAGAAVLAEAVSDSRGAFALAAPGPGAYRLRVSRLGYQGYTTEPLPVASDETVVLELRMGVRALPVEPVLVTARRLPPSRFLEEFERRRDDPGQPGYFIDRAEIERRPIASPSRLVQGLPNVTVRTAATFGDGIIFFPSQSAGGRMCLANVYVDGIRMRTGMSIDELLGSENLAAVEVYPRIAMVPPAYRGSQECGAVLFWTRPGEPSDRGWGLKRILIGLAGLATIVVIGVY